MKKTIITVFLAVFMLSCCSHEKKESSERSDAVKIPEVATKAFATQYPAAKEVKWGVEKPGEYEAEFKLDTTAMSVLYDEKGTLLETETTLKESELPLAIKENLAKDFACYKVDEIEKTDVKGVITYEMIAEKETKELVFDGSGKILIQKEVKEEKENKEAKEDNEENED